MYGLRWTYFLMVLNATFNNISVISVLLVEENREKTTDLSQITDNLYHTLLYTSPWSRFELTTSVVIGTDCIGSCKTNYHTITATMAPCMKDNLFIVDSIHYIVYVLTKRTSICFPHSKILFQILHDSLCTYRTPELHTFLSQTA